MRGREAQGDEGVGREAQGDEGVEGGGERHRVMRVWRVGERGTR